MGFPVRLCYWPLKNGDQQKIEGVAERELVSLSLGPISAQQDLNALVPAYIRGSGKRQIDSGAAGLSDREPVNWA